MNLPLQFSFLFLIAFLKPSLVFPKAESDFKSDSLQVFQWADLCYEHLLKDQDTALYYGYKSLELAKKLQLKKGISQASNDLGYVYYYQGRYDKAKELWMDALAIRKDLKDTLGIASSLNKLGAIHYQIGNFQKSMELHLDAVKYYEAINDSLNLSQTINNIAGIHEMQGHLDPAKKYYQQSILMKGGKDPYTTAASMLNIANIFYRKSEIDSAILQVKDAIKLLKENSFEESQYMAIALNNHSEYLANQKKYDEALAHSKKALSIRTRLGDQQGIISSMASIGTINIHLGHYAEAERSLLNALEAAKDKDLQIDKGKIFKDLTTLYKKKEDYHSALLFTEKYHLLVDSIVNESSKVKISELQTKYETEKKEQQIALQQSEIAEQKAQNQRNIIFIAGLIAIIVLLIVIALLAKSKLQKRQIMLQQAAEIKLRETQIETTISSQEKERSRFAKDLHDGFGQMISILNLNLKSLEDGDKDRHTIFDRSTKVLEEMYQELKSICFNLMPQTLIQHGLAPAIREFAGRINATGKVFVTTDVFGLDKRLTEVQEISLYRITQEWVNNILKYSDADKITIQLTRDEAELTLLIEDNGTGFSIDLLKAGKGHGWRNMNTRVSLIQGELELDTTPGVRGNTLIVNAPALTPAMETTENTVLRV